MSEPDGDTYAQPVAKQLEPLVGKQFDSAQLATERINIWEGSVRSSKTISSLLVWLRFIRSGPPGNLLMVGKTERTLKRNVIDPLIDMLGEKRCRYVGGAGEVNILGRRIYCAGANDEKAQGKIRGMTLAGSYCDELSLIPESFWSMLLTRHSVDGAMLFATSNPDAPAHWLKKKYLDRAKIHLTRDGQVIRREGDTVLDLARFSFQLRDNPWLSEAFLSSLEKEFVGLWRRRYILGEWVAAEGAIYDMWDDDLHVVDDLPLMSKWIGVGIDYGTANPFHACVLGQGVDNRLYLTNEFRYDSRASHRQLTDFEYSEQMRAWLAAIPHPKSEARGVKPQWTVVDPSAASFIVQLFRDGMTPVGGDNSVLDGIRCVSSLLATGGLKIHASCKGLIEEMPGYSWDDDAALKGEDKPIKVDDHGLDAARYVLHTTSVSWQNQITANSPRRGN